MFIASPSLKHIIVVCFYVLLFSFPDTLLAQDNYVRVRLLREASPQTIIVSSTRSMQIYSGDLNNPILELPPREKLTLTTSNTRVYLQANGGGIFASSLILSQPEDAELTVEIAEGSSIPPPLTYNGFFLIRVDSSTPSTLHILNEVPLESYVASVLSSEFNFPELEASKAVAISIRTKTLRHLANQNGPIYAVPDDESWQVYRGTGAIARTSIQAVQETIGQVLLHDGLLAETVYFASSGGHTANNEDVWDASEILPYLRGKEDPYDYNSPHHTWESTISRAELHGLLTEAYKFEVSDVRVQHNSRDKRAQTMLLRGVNNQQKSISGNEFRRVVTRELGREALKSTLFELNTQPNLYIFIGKGFGHGVGLNQWGALELSKRGQLHNEILDYYYPGTTLQVFQPSLVQASSNSIAQSIQSPLSNNVPVIDLNAPPSSPQASTVQPASVTATPSAVPTSASPSPMSLLFGDEEGTGESLASGSEALPSSGEEQIESRRQKIHRELPPDAKVVGWTKTIKPTSRPLISADSAKTKKRRGW